MTAAELCAASTFRGRTGFEGAEGDPAPGEDASSQWASVVTSPEELTWLIEALAMNAMVSEDPDDRD